MTLKFWLQRLGPLRWYLQHMSGLHFPKFDRRIEANALNGSNPEEFCAWALSIKQSLACVTSVMAPFERPTGWPEHLRFQTLPADELLTVEGQCLCCALKSPLADALRRLFMAVLTKKEPKVSIVYIATYSKTPDSLVQTLKHAEVDPVVKTKAIVF